MTRVLNSGWRAWTTPIRDERSHVCKPVERRGGGADRWGRSIDLPAADPAAAQTRWPEAPMDDR
jgi:hypothetical protein